VFTRNFPEKLYPVPVLNLGLRSGGVALNSDQDPANNMLVRRFFIRDEAAAVEATGLPAVAVRHVSTFDLTVTVRHKGGAGRIFPPLLTLTYVAHDTASVTAAEPVDLKFKVYLVLGYQLLPNINTYPSPPRCYTFLPWTCQHSGIPINTN
jgi:hypothetical protein